MRRDGIQKYVIKLRCLLSSAVTWPVLSTLMTATFGYQRFILHLSCPLSKPCSPEYELFLSNGRVVQLRVVYSEGGQKKPLSEYDWEGLDRLVSPFAHIESVIITAHTANGDLNKQESAIVNRMPLLRDRLEEKIMFRPMERVVADSRWH